MYQALEDAIRETLPASCTQRLSRCTSPRHADHLLRSSKVYIPLPILPLSGLVQNQFKFAFLLPAAHGHKGCIPKQTPPFPTFSLRSKHNPGSAFTLPLRFQCLPTLRQGSFSRKKATLPHLSGHRLCHLTGLTWQTWRQEAAIQASPRQLTDGRYRFTYTSTNTAFQLGPLQCCLLLLCPSNPPSHDVWHKRLGQQHPHLQLPCRNTASLSRTRMFSLGKK